MQPVTSDDMFKQAEVEVTLNRLQQLVKTGFIFNTHEHIDNPLWQAAFIEFLIHIRDLLQKLKNRGILINITNDIPAGRNYSDITGLVKEFRDAAAHSYSYKRFATPAANISFHAIIGKGQPYKMPENGPLAALNEIRNEYEDDVCFVMGGHKLYLYRHLKPAYEEVFKAFLALPEFSHLIATK